MNDDLNKIKLSFDRTYLVDSTCLNFGLHHTPFLKVSACKHFKNVPMVKNGTYSTS